MRWDAPRDDAPYWTAEPRKGVVLAPTVFEPDAAAPVKTGILDANGTPLYRGAAERQRIGFLK